MRPPPEFDGDPGMPVWGGAAAWYQSFIAQQARTTVEEVAKQHPAKGHWRAGRVVAGEDEGKDFINGYLAAKYYRELLLWVLDGDNETLTDEEWDNVFTMAKNFNVIEQGPNTKYQEREFNAGNTAYYFRYCGDIRE